MARIPEYIIENAAADLRKRFHLEENSPVNLNALLLRQGILTIYTPMSNDFSGMCLKYDHATSFMLINSSMVLGRQNFTIAHELYHLYIQSPDEFEVHSCNINAPTSPVERRANLFASYFLMPTIAVKEMMAQIGCNKKNINPAHLISMCGFFGVSYQAMLVRADKILKIGEEKYNSLKSIQPLAYARSYALLTDVFETPNRDNLILGDYVSKAHLLYDSEKISKGHLIELMEAIKIG